MKVLRSRSSHLCLRLEGLNNMRDLSLFSEDGGESREASIEAKWQLLEQNQNQNLKIEFSQLTPCRRVDTCFTRT